MRGFDDATILSPSFHGLRKERLAQLLPFCVLNTTKNALQIMSLPASETKIKRLPQKARYISNGFSNKFRRTLEYP